MYQVTKWQTRLPRGRQKFSDAKIWLGKSSLFISIYLDREAVKQAVLAGKASEIEQSLLQIYASKFFVVKIS